MADVHDAVLTVLRTSGTDVLKDSNRFRDTVISQLDEASKEKRALEIGCDESYLNTLSGARGKEELSAATNAATDYLTSSYVMDAEVATSVSYGITSAMAEFLGVDAPAVRRDNQPGAKTRGLGILVAMTFALSVGLLVAGLYTAHLNPIFGCTLFPSSGKLAGISCEWYGTRNSTGQELTIVFLENEGQDTVKMSSVDNHALKASVLPKLATGDEGLMVLQGLGGMTYVQASRIPATKESLVSTAARQVTWSYGANGHGSEKILITNPTDKTIRLYANSIMLASRGATTEVCTVTDLEYLKPGTTEIDVTNRLRPLTLHAGGMRPGDDTNLYLNGAKVPLDSGQTG